jgi:hypothetical protein
MQAVRRLYLFILSGVSLGMLIGGAASLGASAIELISGSAVFGASFRQSLSTAAAILLVGVPVWALHWRAAQRAAEREIAERASALRRLYLYLVLTALLIASVIFATRLLEGLVAALVGTSPIDGVSLLTAAWQAGIAITFWVYHARVVGQDRAAVGEDGASATLRRWYVYGVQVAALLNVLFGTRDLLNNMLTLPGSIGIPGGLPHSVSLALVWLSIWAGHNRWTGQERQRNEDRTSTLRAVAAFIVIGVCVALVLGASSRALYYFLAQALGLPNPGGIYTLDFPTVAAQLSTVVVFGAGWALIRHHLRRDAAETETVRQAGVRRLYQHLVAMLALLALAFGLAHLLDTLIDAATPPSLTTWRDNLSAALTLILVALPTWLVYWRAAPDAAERFAFSRRLYLFAALAGIVLALLIAGATFAKDLLDAALGAGFQDVPKRVSASFATITVATVLGGYHWPILRGDGRQRTALSEPSPLARLETRRYLIEVNGATEMEVRQALQGLPEHARFSLRSEADD